VVRELGLETGAPDLKAWDEYVNRVKNPTRHCVIGVVGKYTHVRDAYKSIIESFVHAGAANEPRLELRGIEAQEVDEEDAATQLNDVDGVMVPGGFGERGIEGKIEASRFARERGVPYFGLCLGMQVATIEFARNVAGWKEANSSEFDPQAPQKVIDLMDEQAGVTEKGGTMRLGSFRF